MKHLFHIHSNTCYLTALGIIRHKKINFTDAIFFIFRNLPVIIKNIKHVHIHDRLYYFPYLTNKQLITFKFIYSKYIIKEIDRIINEHIGTEYIYYAHNSRHYLNSVIKTNKFCNQIEFIEDGLDMYLDRYHYYKKYPNKLWLRHKIINYLLGNILGRDVYKRIKQYNNPFTNKGGMKYFYGLTNSSFSNLLDNQSKYFNVTEKLNYSIKTVKINPGSNVLFFSALVEQKVASHGEINKFLECIVNKFHLANLYIKFHPHQSNRTRQIISKKLKDLSVSFNIIQDSIIIEYLFLKNDQLNVYGIGTSLLIYASYFGNNKVYVLYKLFSEVIGRDTIRTKYWNNTFINIDNGNIELV